MTKDEFDKLRDPAASDLMFYDDREPAFKDGADWAFELLQKENDILYIEDDYWKRRALLIDTLMIEKYKENLAIAVEALEKVSEGTLLSSSEVCRVINTYVDQALTKIKELETKSKSDS